MLTAIPAVPSAVLRSRWKCKNGAMVEQVLIHGSDRASINDT